MRALPLAAALLLAAAPMLAPARAGPAAVTVEIRNDGPAPLRCQLVLGHWVTRGLPVLAPGAVAAFALNRKTEDGALYLMREDGRRRMMVEALVCGDDKRWGESRATVPLDPLRQGAGRRLFAACGTAARVRCHASALP